MSTERCALQKRAQFGFYYPLVFSPSYDVHAVLRRGDWALNVESYSTYTNKPLGDVTLLKHHYVTLSSRRTLLYTETPGGPLLEVSLTGRPLRTLAIVVPSRALVICSAKEIMVVTRTALTCYDYDSGERVLSAPLPPVQLHKVEYCEQTKSLYALLDEEGTTVGQWRVEGKTMQWVRNDCYSLTTTLGMYQWAVRWDGSLVYLLELASKLHVADEKIDIFFSDFNFGASHVFCTRDRRYMLLQWNTLNECVHVYSGSARADFLAALCV